MLSENKQFHINLSKEQVGEYVLLPGDPGRVQQIAQYLDEPQFMAQNREYITYTGTLDGTRVSVTSTGIGGPSAAIALEELIKCGAHTFIRIGTCGGINLNVMAGDIVIPMAAIRGDGTSKEYLAPEYPAAASFDIVCALRQAAVEEGLRHHIGVVQSKDSFYGELDPNSMPVSEYLNERWNGYIKAGCLASEMETASLMCVGLVRGVRVGAVLTTIWNLERPKKQLSSEECFDNSKAINCAINAIRLLIRGTV